MSPTAPFERLHPAVQRHVVNSLGWRTLRPLQTATIEPILAGEHLIATAPTAGGKTEAAVLPLLSRMLSEDWRGLTVLYVCPLRALLKLRADFRRRAVPPPPWEPGGGRLKISGAT